MKPRNDIMEQKFVEHFAEHGNATKAAIHAGYSKNGADRAGHRLLQSKSIKDKIAKIKAELAEKSKWTRERAIERLESIEKKALEDERPNYSAAVKAIETISKLVGLFPEEKKKVELEGDVGVVIKETVTFGDLQNAKGSGN